MILSMLMMIMHLDKRRIFSDMGYILEIYFEATFIILCYVMVGFAIYFRNGRALHANGWVFNVVFLASILVGATCFILQSLRR